MSVPNFYLKLTGYVGGYDFYRQYVDYVLAQNEGKPVNVLFDSLGDSLATALSIACAFRRSATKEMLATSKNYRFTLCQEEGSLKHHSHTKTLNLAYFQQFLHIIEFFFVLLPKIECE